MIDKRMKSDESETSPYVRSSISATSCCYITSIKGDCPEVLQLMAAAANVARCCQPQAVLLSASMSSGLLYSQAPQSLRSS